jgi:hypothetical protein
MQLLRPLSSLLLAAGLAGCSGTPFGDQLSRSFSQPQAAPQPQASASATKPQASPAETGPAAQPKPQPAAEQPSPKPAPAAPVAPATPAPYRVTIKLPAADPSSPAEVVTDALRQAGVAFEVETIERVPAGTDAPAAPVRTPAPPAR